jgi:hypothetical protein
LRVRVSARSEFVAEFSSRFLFLGRISVSLETVEPTGKDTDDRQEVLVLGRAALVAENHEFDALSFEEPLDELESEPAESVTMGYAHFL